MQKQWFFHRSSAKLVSCDEAEREISHLTPPPSVPGTLPPIKKNPIFRPCGAKIPQKIFAAYGGI